MKTHYCKTALLLALMLIAGISLGAQSLKKDVHKEFSATNSSELVIDNQFGNITITDWDQDKIVIDVNIEVTGSDQAKAQKIFDRITIVIKEESSKITAITKLGEDGKLNINNSKNEKLTFRIDYTVKCPKNIKLSLDNQFGDIIIGSHPGSINVDLQFGSLNAVDLTGTETKIDIQFGKMNIGTLNEAEIDIQHCESLKISDCGNLSLDAQFTHIELGTVGSLKTELDNSEVTIEAITDLLKMDMNMGNVKIEHVSAGFKSIVVEQNMGDLTIEIDPKAGYKLNAEVNMGSIKVPEGLKVVREKEKDIPGLSSETVTGTFGNGSSTIRIESNMGSVKIK